MKLSLIELIRVERKRLTKKYEQEEETKVIRTKIKHLMEKVIREEQRKKKGR